MTFGNMYCMHDITYTHKINIVTLFTNLGKKSRSILSVVVILCLHTILWDFYFYINQNTVGIFSSGHAECLMIIW